MSSDTTATVALDDTRRATLAALADELVPNALGMPAASEVDVPGKWIDRALKARPDLASDLVRVLDAAAGQEPVDVLRRLNKEDPDGVGALGTLVTGAYYLHPKVRKLIGYPGQKENPALADEAEYDLRDGILDPVRARAPIYRPTPTA